MKLRSIPMLIFVFFLTLFLTACSQNQFLAPAIAVGDIAAATPGTYTLNATVQAFVDYSCPHGVVCKPTATPSYVVICAERHCASTIRLFDPRYQFTFTPSWQYEFVINVTGEKFAPIDELVPNIIIVDARRI